MIWLICALILANLIAFILMGLDKRRAERSRWRISEKALLIACAFFSAAGGLIGMHVFRHKTRKLKFSLGVPLILAAQIVLLILIGRFVPLA